MSSPKHIPLNSVPQQERPRERLLQQGATALSTSELIAILLRTGNKDENVLHLAQRILVHFDGLSGLARVGAGELMQMKGLGEAKATQILAAIELGSRLAHADPTTRPVIRNATDAAVQVMDMGFLSQEQVRVILLDSGRRLVAITTVYIGTVNASLLRISEIFKEAITRNSPAIILAHNHPSGETTPSPEDIELTRMIAQAGKLLDIEVVDHLIIGGNQWLSIREAGFEF